MRSRTPSPESAGGNGPHERADALDRDTEQRGAVSRLGRRAHGDADTRESEERTERDGHDRHHDQDQQVAPLNDGRVPLEREVERTRRLRGGVEVEQLRQAELAEREQLQDADRRHGQEQARRFGEATDDQELGDRRRAPVRR